MQSSGAQVAEDVFRWFVLSRRRLVTMDENLDRIDEVAGRSGLVERVAVGVLDLEAGDVLIVKVLERIGEAQRQRLRDELESAVPDDVKIAITDSDVEFFVLRRSTLKDLEEQARRLERMLGGGTGIGRL